MCILLPLSIEEMIKTHVLDFVEPQRKKTGIQPGFPTRPDINRLVQSQKKARILKFCVLII